MTKREILRQSSKIYDPLGLIGPVTVRSKMLMQTLWEKGLNWDEPLTSEITTEWKCVLKDINECSHLEINRPYFKEKSDNVELHVFTDASLKAYGACAYLVSGKETVLIMSKNRVTPLKQLTIPKLELSAALIGARLVKHLKSHLDVTSVTLWSDSQITLSWLTTEKQLPVFVSNRVKEINEITQEYTWKYCPTDSNPADMLSRGVTATKFLELDLWMKGPEWLTDKSNWPQWKNKESHILSTTIEQGQSTSEPQQKIRSYEGISKIMDIQRYSSYQKLLRITAYMYRFINNCRNNDKLTGNLSVNEIQTASTAWIRDSQLRKYPDVIECLNNKSEKNVLVKQLRLYMDKMNIIRCGGRINNAPIDESAKFPVLIPNKDRLCKLIVMDAHAKNFHSGLESTVTFIRQSYWIPSIRQCVKSILRNCVTCRKITGRPYHTPDPPPLPSDRLNDSPPFTVTGVDFTGALNVRTKSNSISKAYICLFTCANTRAVHLEIVEDLTEQTFILAFRRFTSRKSLPKIMMSDNCTTYTAAAKEIEMLTKSTTIQEQLNIYGTQWKFIPKRAPWYGGWWERLIGLTKNCIKKVLGRALVTFRVLETIVIEIEAILNDRPLTHVSTDLTDDEPLTPSHLLYGRRVKTLPYSGTINFSSEENVQNLTHYTANRQSSVQKRIIHDFWNRWRREYLTSLREQHRNTGINTQIIKVGDIVQIHDDTPRTVWNIAIIVKLVYGRDGLCRSAILRTKNGTTSRPISKLYPLELLSTDSPCDSSDNTITSTRKAKTDAKEKIKSWIQPFRKA
ncbi:uncharacterized protein [Mytilus edulis]|uniref:uncharacterized protein n=1 Tax=Mytilus edulis TaxID=6550 RepID=UPI0039EE226B